MIGVLLVNLGTPDSPHPKDVRRYLRQFLSDPLVIDINPIARWLLVNGIIAPFRTPKSAKAYQKIWQTEGSPLLAHTRDLASEVGFTLGEGYQVAMAMRYGNPSIEQELTRLVEDFNPEKIIVLPLYPQYAASSTRSSIEEVNRVAALLPKRPPLTFVPPFYDHMGFIRAFTSAGKEALQGFEPDHVLFSFHGLPERHIKREDHSRLYCLKQIECCSVITETNKNCYRAQSYRTANLIAHELGLGADHYSVSFQSRLGRTPWIQPFTDLVIPELAHKGKKKLAVFCPSFVADCLETLEEIGMRGQELFLENGGHELRLIPCPNSSPAWTQAVSDLVRSSH